jgi:galactosylceramidase
VTGDAEQQAILRAAKDYNPGGELLLETAQLQGIRAKEWHNLKLRFQGAKITGLVDGRPVLTATDTLYSNGMAGLMAGGGPKELSTPFFDNLMIKAVDAPEPAASLAMRGQSPIYRRLA